VTESKSCIVAQPGAVDLLIGPLFFAGVLGAAGAFGIASAFWKADEIIDHWEVILFFALIFIPVFIGIWKLNAASSFWKLENGAVYRGGKLLFYLSEIEQAQVGLPDNWINQRWTPKMRQVLCSEKHQLRKGPEDVEGTEVCHVAQGSGGNEA
jgi:hypothetical protein